MKLRWPYYVLLVSCAGTYPLSCSGDQGGSSGGGGGGGGEGGDPAGTTQQESSSGQTTSGGGSPDELRLKFEEISGVNDGNGAVDFRFVPGESDEIVMLARNGQLAYLRLTGTKAKRIDRWDVPDDLYLKDACVPTNLVFDPHFSDNGFVYLSYCTTPHDTRLVRYDLSLSKGLSDLQVVLETYREEGGAWHRFGAMDFEEDGDTLWVLVGDHTNRKNGRDVQTIMGGLIRILPNRAPEQGGYEAAPGNMIDIYEAEEGAAGAPPRWDEEPTPELYAYGLRSPFRGTRDSQGRFWVGDVGDARFEEVNLITKAGQNLGWSSHEGPCTADCDGFVDPIVSYGRGDHPYADDDPATSPATKRTIWVGEIYEDPAVDRYAGLMNGVVAFGDFFTGWVRGLKADDRGRLTMDRAIGHLEDVVSWRVGPDGYVYVLTVGGGLYRAVLDAADD